MNLRPAFLFLFLLCLGPVSVNQAQDILKLNASTVAFTSNAPLEIIKAETDEMAGVIDASKGTFAFRIPMRSFRGFNSPLQMEHFHENYMESNHYKNAAFSGRIIEDVDFSVPGIYTVRAKGSLEIHGVVRERIIKSTIDISEDIVRVFAEFTVPLSDHDISIPKIVEQKIAHEISVKLEATFTGNEAP